MKIINIYRPTIKQYKKTQTTKSKRDINDHIVLCWNTSPWKRHQKIVMGLTNALNRTSNKVKSSSIVSQETCVTLDNSFNS